MTGNDKTYGIKYAASMNKKTTNNQAKIVSIQTACMALIENDDAVAELEAVETNVTIANLDITNEENMKRLKLIIMCDSDYSIKAINGKTKIK